MFIDFAKIEEEFESRFASAARPEECAAIFNAVLFSAFKDAGLKPVFVGQYILDPDNPEQTRLFANQGTPGCSPIPIKTGIIGRAIREQESQYVPDVHADPEHFSCDEAMEGTELVLLGPINHSVVSGVLDIDLNVKDALSRADQERITTLWDAYADRIL